MLVANLTENCQHFLSNEQPCPRVGAIKDENIQIVADIFI
jgi:hypothetical protein